jgi:hypothetical protein
MWVALYRAVIYYLSADKLVYRHWLWPVKFALEGAVASEIGIPGVRSGDRGGGQGVGPARPIQAFLCLLDLGTISFDIDWSAICG